MYSRSCNNQITRPGREVISINRPYNNDMAKAASGETLKNPKPITITPSRTPQPAIEIGTVISNDASGIIIIIPIKLSSIFIELDSKKIANIDSRCIKSEISINLNPVDFDKISALDCIENSCNPLKNFKCLKLIDSLSRTINNMSVIKELNAIIKTPILAEDWSIKSNAIERVEITNNTKAIRPITLSIRTLMIEVLILKPLLDM
jgi:hypothetical protein